MEKLSIRAHEYLVPLSLIFGILLLSTTALAQAGAATLVGTVTDQSGAAVPNAKVTITNIDNGFVRNAATNSTGGYTASNLGIGRYKIKVEKEGFKAYEKTGIVLTVNETTRADAALQVGGSDVNVTVEASALQVQSETNEVSSTVTDKQVAQLATNGRNVLQLTALVPGAASQMPDFDVPVAQYQNRSVTFNGQRSDHNNWIIDGGEAYDRGGGGILIVAPSQDAIQEFKVTTSNYSADLGNASGGMITMALKQGTTKYHGSAWEYNRNDALNAYSWISKHNSTNPQKQKLRYNTFGFNFGGPLNPWAKSPKTFFFYNMEWRRYISGDTQINAQTPNAAQYAGNMTGLGTIHVPNQLDPAELPKYAAVGLVPGAAFPNNTIPASLINPNAKAFLATGAFPLPNSADGTRFVETANSVDNYREEAVRLDHQFNDKFTLMGHLIWDNGSEDKPLPLWTGTTYPSIGTAAKVPSWSGVVHATYTINPTLLNEVTFNTNGNNLNIGITGNYLIPSGWNSKQFFPAVNTSNKLPTINISVPFAMNYDPSRWPWNNTWRAYQWKDDVSWSRGAHNIRFGGDYMYNKKFQPTDQNIGGAFTFNGNATGVGLADFLLGYAATYTQPQFRTAVNIATHNVSLYGLDDWKITKKLTLNLGLRWEYIPHAYDQNNALANFYPDLYNPANAATFLPGGALDPNGPGFGTVPGVPLSNVRFYLNGIGIAGTNGIPRGLTTNTWKTFAPRVGFAYDMTGKGTVLRGGFGMFYERIAGNEEYNMMNNVPFTYQPSVTNVYLNDPAVGYQDGVNSSSAYSVTNIIGTMRKYDVPTTIQYNLGIQQGVGNVGVLNIAYVGNTAYHQSLRLEVNGLPLSDTANRLAVCGGNCVTGTPNANPNLFRPFKGWGTIGLASTSGNAHYNSLQVSMRTSSWKNLTLGATYTWSHAFDLNDGDNFNPVDNPYDIKYNWGSAGFDRRQVFNLTYIYNLPFFRNSDNKFAKGALGGWTISGVTLFSSGTPLQVNAPIDVLGVGGDVTNHANLVAPVTYPKTSAQWFSTSSFAAPTPLQWGTSPRGSIIGPGRNNWNISMFKNFQFTERVGFEFRAESFNTFNHTQFTGLGTNLTGGDFGKVTAAADGRVFQLGARLFF